MHTVRLATVSRDRSVLDFPAPATVHCVDQHAVMSARSRKDLLLRDRRDARFRDHGWHVEVCRAAW